MVLAWAGSCSSNLTPSLELRFAVGAGLKRKRKRKRMSPDDLLDNGAGWWILWGGGAQAIRALGVLGGGAQGGATAVLPSLTLGPGIRFGKSEA